MIKQWFDDNASKGGHDKDDDYEEEENEEDGDENDENDDDDDDDDTDDKDDDDDGDLERTAMARELPSRPSPPKIITKTDTTRENWNGCLVIIIVFI